MSKFIKTVFAGAMCSAMVVVVLCLYYQMIARIPMIKNTISEKRHTQSPWQAQHQCNGQCTTRQRCFMGLCYCLPGFAGKRCTNQTIYHKVDAAACPSYTSVAEVRAHRFGKFQGRCDVNPWSQTSTGCEIFCNWQEDAGIVSVSPSIWEQVSDNEFAHHVHYAVATPDRIPEGQTRWAEYAEGFQRFHAFPQNKTLGHYLEVGAGLYTNIYYILQYRPDVQPRSITLVEPNIQRYTTMPQCLYQDGNIRGHPVKLVNATTESLNATEEFDTILIMNVIEHVLDAFDFLDATYRALRPGGILVWGERYFEDPDEASTKVLGSTMLHPIRLKREFVQDFLSLFHELYIAPFSETTQVRKRGNGEQGYFFIGRKMDPGAPNTA
jgi:SAM-dependent methyltransferase